MLKSQKLLFALLAIFLMATALPTAAGAAGTCTPSTTLWVVGGKATCLKSAAATSPKKVTKGQQAASWILRVKKPVPGSKFRLPAKFKRALPAAARSASKLLDKTIAMPFKPNAKKKSAIVRRTAVTAASPVTDRMTQSTPEIEAPGGVTMRGVAEMVKRADGTIDASVSYELTKNGETVVLRPIVNEFGKSVPDVGCPTADGLLTIDYSSVDGMTVILKKGNSVKKAITEKVTTTTHATGHVGRDAKLASVDANVTVKSEHYERGMQLVTSVKGNAEMQRDSDQVIVSQRTAEVKLRVAGASSKAEQEWEGKAAAAFAADQDRTDRMVSAIDLMRWKMLQDEFKWYQLPNYCAKIVTNPASVAAIDQGQSKAVDAVVIADDGGESPGAFTVESVSRGGYSLVKAESDPGAPAKFSATGGEPASDNTTVAASMIATSKAGRTQSDFYAEADPIKVPTTFSGALVSKSTTPGLLDEFKMIATWDLKSKTPGPNGFAQVWYELTEVILESSSNEIGVGCRWVAKGTNGTINAGDLELRRASAAAPWTYAFMVDVSVLDATFAPTDCPPGSGMQPFTGDIVNVLNSHKVGAQFRPVDTSHNDFRMIEEDQTDVIGPGNLDTVASWAVYSY